MTASSKPRMAVLLVEDDPATQALIPISFEDVDIDVDVVATMFDALEMLALAPKAYRAVIVDLNLPDIHGPDSIHLIVSAVSVPIVVFSGQTDEGVQQRCLELGAAAVVSKDDGPERLAVVVSDVLATANPALNPMPEAIRASAVSADFEALVSRTLRFLQAQIPMGAWMFTRVQGNDWVVLDVVGDDYELGEGTVLRWDDSFCSRMVNGDGPRIALEPQSIAAYRDAPVAKQLSISTYIGLPIAIADVGLFGTLCGISPDLLTTSIATATPFLDHTAELLSGVLALDLQRDRLERRLTVAKLASMTDTLTGLPNRRAFELLIRVEEARCKRYGSSAAVVSIDLDGLKTTNDTLGHAAGDQLIIEAAHALDKAKRSSDVAFRVGGDEFALLAPECASDALSMLVDRYEQALQTGGIAASLGGAVRSPSGTLEDTIKEADMEMYRVKGRRRTLA